VICSTYVYTYVSVFNYVTAKFLSGFWPREVEMRCNGILRGGQSGMILLEAKHMAN